MIEIESLTHVYPATRKTLARVAINGLSLRIKEGEFAILSGPNGSGKSSLFRILCGLSTPTSGSIRINGVDLLKNPEQIRPLMGVVFQSPAVDKHLSVAENLAIHADLYAVPRDEYEARRTEALQWTDLGDRLDQKVDTLSGGLARQVELAKVLLTRPRILLLDEPTTGLDPASRRNFLSALRRLQRERGMTVLMTSHVFTEADDVDRVAIMKEGVLLAWDTPAALKAMIGKEMLVLQPTDPDRLAQALKDQLGLTVMRHGDELRLEETENGAGLPLAEKILERFRPEILSLAIKRPDLDDVFVHITGRSQSQASQADASAAASTLKTGT